MNSLKFKVFPLISLNMNTFLNYTLQMFLFYVRQTWMNELILVTFL